MTAWEVIAHKTWRMPVYGGWIVRWQEDPPMVLYDGRWEEGRPRVAGMVFVPDPNRAWVVP